jgi:hypothetical protein
MRRVLAFVLLLLGALATVLAATSLWASRSLLDESGWERRAAAIADDPAVATAISDAILERVTVKLPPKSEQQLRVAVATALKEPQVQTAWARLNRAAAAALLDAARGEPNDNVNAKGDVVLDAEPLLQSLAAADKGPLADLLAQHQAREIVLVRASELDPLRRATDASNLAPPILIALAIVLLGLGAVTARTAGGALAATFVCLLGACIGVLAAFLAARDQALQASKSALTDTIIASTFDAAERPLAIVVGGACVAALGLVAVVAGLRARARSV